MYGSEGAIGAKAEGLALPPGQHPQRSTQAHEDAHTTAERTVCLPYWGDEMEYAREVFEPVAAWLRKLARDDHESLELVAAVLNAAAGSVWFATEHWELVEPTRDLAVWHGTDSAEITRLWWELFNRPPKRAERRLLKRAAKLCPIGPVPDEVMIRLLWEAK